MEKAGGCNGVRVYFARADAGLSDPLLSSIRLLIASHSFLLLKINSTREASGIKSGTMKCAYSRHAPRRMFWEPPLALLMVASRPGLFDFRIALFFPFYLKSSVIILRAKNAGSSSAIAFSPLAPQWKAGHSYVARCYPR